MRKHKGQKNMNRQFRKKYSTIYKRNASSNFTKLFLIYQTGKDLKA